MVKILGIIKWGLIATIVGLESLIAYESWEDLSRPENQKFFQHKIYQPDNSSIRYDLYNNQR